MTMNSIGHLFHHQYISDFNEWNKNTLEELKQKACDKKDWMKPFTHSANVLRELNRSWEGVVDDDDDDFVEIKKYFF